MTAIAHNSGAPSFLAPAPAFSFFEQAEISVPAPEIYEHWRLDDIVWVCDEWFFHQPTIEFINAETEEQALSLVAQERQRSDRWYDGVYQTGHTVWENKRPWWWLSW